MKLQDFIKEGYRKFDIDKQYQFVIDVPAYLIDHIPNSELNVMIEDFLAGLPDNDRIFKTKYEYFRTNSGSTQLSIYRKTTSELPEKFAKEENDMLSKTFIQNLKMPKNRIISDEFRKKLSKFLSAN